MNAKDKVKGFLPEVFNRLSGKKGLGAAIMTGLAVAGTGAAIGTAVAVIPVVPVILAADTAVWIWGSNFHAKRDAKKKGLRK